MSMNVDQAVALAYRHWEAGQPAQAEQLCRQALQAWPGQAGALHLLGLMAHSYGNSDAAIQYLIQACDAPRVPALYFSNLAEMQRQRGQLEAAEAAARRAVARDENLGQGWNNLGIILQEQAKLDESLICLQRAAALSPGNAEMLNNLGNTFARLGALDQAWGHYTQALALNPAYAEAHSNLASVLRSLGRYDEALVHVEQAIELNPRLADAYLNAASIFHARGANGAAMTRLDGLLAFAPSHVRALLLYAQILDTEQRGAEALALCSRAAGLAANDGEVQLTLAKLLQSNGQPQAAQAAATRAAGLLANPAEALSVTTTLLLEDGQMEAALASSDAALAQDPKLAAAWLSRSELKHFARGDADIPAMQKLLGADGVQAFHDQLSLHFALAKAYLDHDDAARAFYHFEAGNRMKRSEIKFDLPQTIDWMAAIETAFPASRFAKPAGAADDDAVFVIGMPRSGTSLIEQVLASHADLFGAGELTAMQSLVTQATAARKQNFPDFVAALEPAQLREIGEAYGQRLRTRATASRIIDKMPSNFFHAGLIHLALPNARIIHVRRDAADTCLSCYTKIFSSPQQFAYDLEELGKFHIAYQKLMAHWRAVLPASQFIEVDYEKFVADLEGQARRLVEFCGLEWDDACLRYSETQRAVRTASAAQVRRPLYRSSIGRAQRYRKYLAPLFDALEVAECV
jgi:tetratricopeptide (TPR) repeat protein